MRCSPHVGVAQPGWGASAWAASPSPATWHHARMTKRSTKKPRRRAPRAPVSGLRLINVRAFEDTNHLDFGRVNFIFGKNSSGKTTVLRSLLLLKQLVQISSVTGEVPFAGPYVDFGSYQETVHNGLKSKDIVLIFDCDLPRRLAGRPSADLPTPQAARVTITLHWNATRGHSQVGEIIFHDLETDHQILRLTRRGPDRVRVEAAELPAFEAEGVGELSFQTLQPYLSDTDFDEIHPELDIWMFRFYESLRLATSRILNIGPLRDMPERAYRTDQLVVPAGATQSMLGVMTAEPHSIAMATTALTKLGVASRVEVVRPAPGYAGITVQDIRTGRRDNLADVGFGVSQVLPIIVHLATAPRNSLILIEQPELHLHPETQGALVDVLLDLAEARNLVLLVESHSENMLLRLRRHVASGRVSPDEARIYVANNGFVNLAGVDAQGGVDMSVFPEDFFEEEWLEAVELAKAARRQQ